MEYPELESMEPDFEEECEVLFDEDEEAPAFAGWWGDEYEDALYEQRRERELFGL